MSHSTVLLLFGGESSEHEVSVASARNVYAAIDNEKYDVLLGYIDKRGHWWLLDEFPYDDEVITESSQQLLPALGAGGFMTMTDGHVIRPDVILPILHGENGEDGSVQGLAQLMHIPIVGCGVAASAIGMDKVASKRIVSSVGVNIVPYRVYRRGDQTPDYHDLVNELGEPLFVKPSAAGSSVGVSRVTEALTLEGAIKAAAEHDDTVLIEQGVSARELEVGVIGDYPDTQVSVVGEVVPEGEFYSYESKYAAQSTSQVIIPADLPENVSETIRSQARKIYEALGCGGFARVDFFLAENGEVYFNEVNTLPGFTNISMFPKLWQASGVGYGELIERLIELRLPTRIE